MFDFKNYIDVVSVRISELISENQQLRNELSQVVHEKEQLEEQLKNNN